MKEKSNIRLNLQEIFDGKVGSNVCNKFNKLCGNNKTIPEIKVILNSSRKHYLSAIGLPTNFDYTDVNITNASYLYVLPDGYTTKNGEQIVAWLHREKVDGSFRDTALEIGTKKDLDCFIAKKNMCSIGALKFDNWQRKKEFLDDLSERVKPKDEKSLNKMQETIKEVSKKYIQNHCVTALNNNDILFDSKLETETNWVINIKGRLSQIDKKVVIINPNLTIHPRKKRTTKNK